MILIRPMLTQTTQFCIQLTVKNTA